MTNMTSSLTLQPTSPAAHPFQTAAEILGTALTRREGPQIQVALGVAQAWSFDVRHEAVKIEVIEGEVMVTFEGDPTDHVLTQGAVFTTPRRGRVAAAAFRPSRFSVMAR